MQNKETTNIYLEVKDPQADKKSEKILNSYHGDIEPLMDRIQAVLDAGEDYQTYTDIADGVNGSIKFIYKTDAVKED